MFEESPLLRKAYEVALAAHQGNTRKGTDIPEFTHPEAVARLVAGHGFSEAQIAAALLHDVIEDTPLSTEELTRDFPPDVMTIVLDLTEDEGHGSRSASWLERKQGKLERLRSAHADSLPVCAADRLHNLITLIEMARDRGPSTWDVFSRGPEDTLWFEKEVVAILTSRFDHPILAEYRSAVMELEAVIASFGRPN